jgi:hypothetical protein
MLLIFPECYADSCEQAAAESGLSPKNFPSEPTFTLDQALDPGFLPERPPTSRLHW